MRKYTRLTYSERCQIEVLYRKGESYRAIGRAVNRHETTIAREIRRHSTIPTGYSASRATSASYRHYVVRGRKRRKIQGALQEHVCAGLEQYFSPQQISGRLKRLGLGTISHESIYRFIHDTQHSWLYRRFLRHSNKRYQKRNKGIYAGRGYIPHRRDIEERPAIIEQKSRIGDWELDTIVGCKRKGYLVSIVERYSKYTLLVRTPDSKAKTVARAIIKACKNLTDNVHTFTADNGKEFAKHRLFSRALKATCYFAKPYHSWQRGLNEHTNGLVRQFFPKNTNFLDVTDKQVLRVQNLLNTRPRKALDFQTPQEVFYATR